MMGSMNSTASSASKEASDTGSNTQTRLTRIRGPSRESNTVSQTVNSDISQESNDIIPLLLSDDDDITIIESNEPQMPHARKDCLRHRFCPLVNATATSNVPHCDTCFCYVCDIPAKDCRTWQEHCNVIDDVSGKHLRLCNKNKFYSTLVGLVLKSPPSTVLPVREEEEELYNMRSKVVSKVDRGFRVYEAGQPMENTAVASSVEGGWQHKFGLASTYFQRVFFRTRASSVHDKDLCGKLILLDALTETVVKRTYRKPEHSSGAVWDSNAGRIYDRMCLSVGSRWITFAFMATYAQPEIVDQFHERFEAFAAMAKERYNFDRAFNVVREMFKYGGSNFIQPSSPLLKSVQRRWVLHATTFEDNHQSREKLEEVMLKDKILLKGCHTLLENKNFSSEETVAFKKQLNWVTFVQNMSVANFREFDLDLIIVSEHVLKHSMKRYGYFVNGPSMMKGMMLDRLSLVGYLFCRLEEVLKQTLYRTPECGNCAKCKTTMTKTVALFKLFFKTIAKLLEFIGSGLDTEENISTQAVRVTGALQEVLRVAGRFPYPVFATSQMKDLTPAIHFYYETVNGKLQTDDFFRPLQTSLRALYDDPNCLAFRDIFTSFKDHGGDIFRLTIFTRRLRRRLQ